MLRGGYAPPARNAAAVAQLAAGAARPAGAVPPVNPGAASPGAAAPTGDDKDKDKKEDYSKTKQDDARERLMTDPVFSMNVQDALTATGSNLGPNMLDEAMEQMDATRVSIHRHILQITEMTMFGVALGTLMYASAEGVNALGVATGSGTWLTGLFLLGMGIGMTIAIASHRRPKLCRRDVSTWKEHIGEPCSSEMFCHKEVNIDPSVKKLACRATPHYVVIEYVRYLMSGLGILAGGIMMGTTSADAPLFSAQARYIAWSTGSMIGIATGMITS